MQTSSHVTTQPHHSQASTFTFRSTLAKTLSQVLPIDSTLKQFDLLRSRVKQAKEMRASEHKYLLELSHKLNKKIAYFKV